MESFKQQLIDPATLLSKQSRARDSSAGIYEEPEKDGPGDTEGEDGRTIGAGEQEVDQHTKVNSEEIQTVAKDEDTQKQDEEERKPTEMTDGLQDLDTERNVIIPEEDNHSSALPEDALANYSARLKQSKHGLTLQNKQDTALLLKEQSELQTDKKQYEYVQTTMQNSKQFESQTAGDSPELAQMMRPTID